MHGWRDHELLSRGLGLFGLSELAETSDAPAAVADLAKRRQQARAERDFDEADRLRAEIESAGWIVRDVDDGFRLVPK
jgi:cysteinyl-tRNA synthetase